MKTFNFYQDIKCTVWQRQHFSIDAETEEEAIEKAKQYSDKDVYNSDEYVYDTEWLYDTEELMYPEENGGCSTIQIYIDKKPEVCLADNAI